MRRARLQTVLPGKNRSVGPGAVQYRRAPFLISYWRDNQLVFENYLTQRRVSANPLTSTILHFFDRERPLRALCAAFTEYTPASLRKAVQMLVRHSLLQRQGAQTPAWGKGASGLERMESGGRIFPFVDQGFAVRTRCRKGIPRVAAAG